jgi:hypothetical protein
MYIIQIELNIEENSNIGFEFFLKLLFHCLSNGKLRAEFVFNYLLTE